MERSGFRSLGDIAAGGLGSIQARHDAHEPTPEPLPEPLPKALPEPLPEPTPERGEVTVTGDGGILPSLVGQDMGGIWDDDDEKGWPSPPAGPDMRPVLIVHRMGETFIRFSKDNGRGNVMPIADIRVKDIKRWFPQNISDLQMDSYYSLSGFYRRGTGQSHDVRALNACALDFDYYDTKRGAAPWMTRRRALDAIEAAVETKALPPASMIVDSGRGLWLLFLLVGDDGMPPVHHPHKPENLNIYQAIQDALLTTARARLAALAPDPANNQNAGRLTRVPGSINTKPMIPVTVRYRVQVGDGGRVIAYTLQGLAARLGVDAGSILSPSPPPPEEPRGLTPPTPGSRPGYQRRTKRVITDAEKAARVTGHRAVNRARLSDFEALLEMRGRIQEGHRNSAALIYSSILRRAYTRDNPNREKIPGIVAHFGEYRCTPRLFPSEVTKAIKSGMRYAFTDAEIIRRLDITPAELAMMDTIQAGRYEKGASVAKNPKPTERRAELVKILTDAKPYAHTSRSLAALLSKRGFRCNHVTVNADLIAVLKKHHALAAKLKKNAPPKKNRGPRLPMD